MPTGTNHHHVDNTGATDAPHRIEADKQAYCQYHSIYLELNPIHICQFKPRSNLLYHILGSKGIGEFADAHWEQQGHRHHAETLGKEQEEKSCHSRADTLADSQLPLAVVEHLDDELQEVHDARYQDERTDQKTSQFYPNGFAVSFIQRISPYMRIFIARLQVDLVHPFLECLHAHALFDCCLNRKSRIRKVSQREINVCMYFLAIYLARYHPGYAVSLVLFFQSFVDTDE